MAWRKYYSTFYSKNDFSSASIGSHYKMEIYKKGTQGSEPGNVEFKCTGEGFVLNMEGGEDGILAPIKTTSVGFNFIIEGGDADQAEIIDDLYASAANNEGSLVLQIYRDNSTTSVADWKRYWFGVLLGDLSAGKDTTPNRIISIKAVDGLAQLKYKKLDQDTFGGNRSCLSLIKVCLSQLTTTDDEWAIWSTNDVEKRNFIAHTPYYYNEAMADGGSLDGTWKNNVDHDPLALTYLSTAIFQNKNGQTWSYYKILEQILSAFQLRIMMTAHRNDTGGSTMEDGNALWFIQAPFLFHNNDNNSGYDNDQIIFYHNKTTSTDTAIEVDVNYVCDDGNPEQKLSGTQEHFIPPLLSYQSIYKHDLFQPIISGPHTWNSAFPLYGHNANYNYYEQSYNIDIPLTNRTPLMVGWTGDSDVNVGNQRFVITGNVSIKPIDAEWYAGNTDNAYVSAQEYWEDNYYLAFSSFIFYANDECKVFPRMGFEADVTYEQVVSDNYNTEAFFLGSMRWGNLYGSVPWSSNSTMLSYETDQYPSNYRGFDGSSDGLRFNLSSYNSGSLSSVYTDGDGAINWGTDIGPAGEMENAPGIVDWMYWKQGQFDFNQVGMNGMNFGWFSPYYFDGESIISIYDFSAPIEWPDSGSQWGSLCAAGTYTQTQPFYVVSPFVPWPREAETYPAVDADFGNAYINQIRIIFGVPRDRAIDGADTYYTACKNWDKNRFLDCKDRGVQYVYEYSDVRVFVMGATGGSSSYDASYGWYENGNGTPSEEIVQEPEIVIGDEPAFDPFAEMEDNIGTGEYLGMFRIYTTANPTGGPVEADTNNDWRTEAMGTSGTEDMQLHHIRAKMALSHYYIMKKKLEISFLDRSSNRTIESCPFGQVYTWSSGDYATNQVGTDIAFMPCSGKFTAGTGQFTFVLEDCVTYSKDSLVSKNYSSNG